MKHNYVLIKIYLFLRVREEVIRMSQNLHVFFFLSHVTLNLLPELDLFYFSDKQNGCDHTRRFKVFICALCGWGSAVVSVLYTLSGCNQY